MKSPPAAAPCENFGYSSVMSRPSPLSDRARELVAARFRALGEPTRLKILERLFRSSASVGEILQSVGGTQANVSKHLAVLRAGRLVGRRKAGNRIVYSISDPALERICAIVCDSVTREAHAEAKAVAPTHLRGRR
ncbi:MAG TPA: metalloregulator ArsR/SmtB family transcription factor [Thermoanaerobaculia bacterium]|nr:metalloregulator ArsR/SmtB family transcription factor [Thermoanaerobaculia bacterium]